MRTIFITAFLFFVTSVSAQQIKSIKITELEKTIKESKTPLIVNFWATFCIPCIKEIPYFQEMTRKYKSQGVSLLLVSLDLRASYPNKISSMARRLHFTAPIVWLNETNADYFCPIIDSTWSGGLPSSLFVNNTTGYYKFLEDEIAKEKLEKQIQEMLKPK